MNSLSLYKEKIVYCNSTCRAKIISSPPVMSALPEEFKVTNELDGNHAVKLAQGHTILAHTTTECSVIKNESQVGYLTLFMCQADAELLNHRSYVICHFHSLVEQFSVAMFISSSEYCPLELLPGSKYDDSHKTYIESLYSTAIVPTLLMKILSKHQVNALEDIGKSTRYTSIAGTYLITIRSRVKVVGYYSKFIIMVFGGGSVEIIILAHRFLHLTIITCL